MEGGQTDFLPGRLQRLKMALSCHMKPIKVQILPHRRGVKAVTCRQNQTGFLLLLFF